MGLTDEPKLYQSFPGKQIMNTIGINDPDLTIFGESVIGFRSHDISIAFNYNISTDDVTIEDTGTGTSEFDQNTIKLTPGTGVGLAQARSRKTVTYRPGTEAFGMFTIVFENGGESGLNQGLGIMDGSDGFFIGYEGSQFSIARRKGGVTIWTPESEFNGEDISWLDKTKLNIYMIRYGWLGIGPISYYVYFGPDRKWIRMHSTDLTNKQTLPHINTPILPICAFSERLTGTGTNAVMRSGSWRGGIVNGGEEDPRRQFAFTNSKAGVSTALTNIFTLSNKNIFQGVTNKTSILLELISIASDGTKNLEISMQENATLGGTPSFTDINTTNSVMEVDIAGTTVTDGIFRFATSLGKVDSEVVPLIIYKYIIHPGETMTFAARAISGTTEVTYAVNWGEIF